MLLHLGCPSWGIPSAVTYFIFCSKTCDFSAELISTKLLGVLNYCSWYGMGKKLNYVTLLGQHHTSIFHILQYICIYLYQLSVDFWKIVRNKSTNCAMKFSQKKFRCVSPCMEQPHSPDSKILDISAIMNGYLRNFQELVY